MNDWKTRVTPIHALPQWGRNVPSCSTDECPEYDGKRCKLMGFRPDGICEPTVEAMGKLLDES